MEDESLFSIDNLPDADDITEWLVKVDAPPVSRDELERDRSYMDARMMAIKDTLCNFIKADSFELKSRALQKNRIGGLAFKGIPKFSSALSLSSKLAEVKASTNNNSVPLPRASAINNFSPARSLAVFKAQMSLPTTPKHRNANGSEAEHGPLLASSPLSIENRFNLALDSAEFTNSPNYIETPPRNIDTRTFSRPRKNRMSLEGHMQALGSYSTATISKQKPSPALLMGNMLNTTVTFPSHDTSNTTSPNRNNNLNETFNKDKCIEDETPAELNSTVVLQKTPLNNQKNKLITRNLSYVVPKSSNENANNQQRNADLNETFVCEDVALSPADSNGDTANNLSMEELHVMARLQEQSLKDASPARTLTRKDTRVLMNFNPLESNVPKRPTRTSSTDTYSVGQSNPESPGSSGLSSPLDAQSYDNLQADAFRRSMPDLAITRRLSTGNSGIGAPHPMSLAPPLNNLKTKPYHTSDTRLSHHTGLQTRLTLTKQSNSMFNNNRNTRIPSPGSSNSSSVEANLQTRHLPNQGIRNGQPRIAKPVLRQPQSMLLAPGFSQQIRPSRIPAPGSARSSIIRPSTASGTRQGSANMMPQKDSNWKDGCY